MTPELEIIAVRITDGFSHLEAFLGGEPIEATEFVIDAGSAAG